MNMVDLVDLRYDLGAQSFAVDMAARLVECLGLAQRAELNITFYHRGGLSGIAFAEDYSREFGDLADLRAICYLRLRIRHETKNE